MLEYFKKLSEEYNMPINNIISIALNRYGIICNETEESRLRFNLRILDDTNKSFFAVCVNTYLNSPFLLKKNKLYLDGNIIADVSEIEKDTCTSTYFRNNKKVITFNSNARSKCVGCKFCGTYSISNDDNIDFSDSNKIQNYFEKLLEENQIKSMSDIENITVCTGCFENEDALIKHLLDIKEGIGRLNFNGSINYIGSQLRDYNKILELHKQIPNFGIYLTIEKFLDREKFMRSEKASLTLDKCKDLLKYTSDLGITSTFLYILGLEDLETVKKYMTYFKDSVNKFPIIQIFQDYTIEQENYRIEDAKDVEYYLKARKIIGEVFEDSGLVPKSWECFRSLHFDNEKQKVLRLKND